MGYFFFFFFFFKLNTISLCNDNGSSQLDLFIYASYRKSSFYSDVCFPVFAAPLCALFTLILILLYFALGFTGHTVIAVYIKQLHCRHKTQNSRPRKNL